MKAKKIVSIILTICIVLSCVAVGIMTSAQAIEDYSNGFPTKDGYHTVVFTNNKNWENVNIYSWTNATQQAVSTWPGSAMTFACTNGYNETQYIAYVPAVCDRIIFNNGIDQTNDITILGNCAYYLDGDSSPYNVGTFEVVFITPDAPTEPESTEPGSSESVPTESESTEPGSSDSTPTEPSTGDSEPVETKEPELVFQSADLNLKAGQTAKAVVSAEKGEKVTFSSSKPTTAKIDSKGNITARQKGTTVITATIGKKTIKKTITVTTSPTIKKGKNVVKNNKIVTVKKGETLKLTITGKASDIKNTVKIKNSKIAKITSKATQSKVTLKAKKKGTTTLTVKINGVKSYKIKIRVK